MKRLFYDVPQHLRANFIWLYWDIAVWGLYTGSTVVFLSVYAVRAGATSEQIGWLNAGPALVALLTSIPAGLLARRSAPKRITVIAAALGRLPLLAYVLIPSLIPPEHRVAAILIVTILMAFPNTVLGIGFGPFFLRAIPAEWRGTVVGVRNGLMSILSFFVTLLCGQLLVMMAAPAGYQVVFFIGFVGASLTIYVLTRVTQVGPPAPPAPAPARESAGKRHSLFPGKDPAGRHYVVVIFMLFGLNSAGYMAAPLLPQFTVNTLRLNDAVISVGSAMTSMLVFLVSLFVIRLIRRIGNRKATAAGAALLCAQMLVLAAAQDALLYLVAAVIGGFASGILMAGSFNYHLENLPPLDQTIWISWNSFLGNIAALSGSILGPALAGVIGIPSTLAVLGLLRLFIAGIIYVWG